MDWWYGDDEEYYKPEPTKKEEMPIDGEPTWQQKVCIHLWKPTILIISTVYDCSKCGIKKEDYEEWQKKRNPF